MDGKALFLIALLAQSVAAPTFAAPVAPEQSEAPGATPVVASDSQEKMSPEAFVASLHFKKGKVVVGDNLATFDLPDSFVFLDGADAERVLEAWGNPPSEEQPLGMLMPAGISPFDKESWAVTVEYEESGYVSDEDAEKIDYTQMLKDMQGDLRESNPEREKQGFEPIQLIGWAAPPRYDAAEKKLYWAKELQFGDAREHTLNYNIRVLGRKGVLVLNFVASMEQLPEIEKNVGKVLAMAEFNPGSRYLDFNPSVDKVAAYGLGALIAGKVAAKAGLFAMLLVLLKKLWIVPALAIGWISRRFKRKAS
ncbi:DUF2167 domain-containing protein [Pseudomonas sp. ZM23]|uniref:DUF2167 domain-containing protein n=1 Tax=Pseudomonas triclosanedens TaxID=2961893 RepID=A0ABY7A555_9PSED|nr:DUF2167 domain-containing protein [Pseudomonas triclosanedens]MCP8464259.1 DUF2167 domain-containing protein [Pseudomonas triclosanedens]MCP8471393.1 DUF2167 domain-containing protein [Pseudomonas triclosanedens]MCP8477798.1 DUF2167 domain-containing protein [Pseudomonas triclosanedens]WAI51249.1 DUF2167 domain-containing protein [Pseudomonas triclosanedens]